MGYKYHLPEDHDSDDVRARDLWKGFRQDTTAHGIPHVSNAAGVCKKIFWLIVSLAACGFLVYHLYTAFDTYFQYNTTVKITIQQEFETEFPTVTVCNLNPIKRSALHLDAVLDELLSDSDRKRRRKRQITDMTCTNSNTYNRTGLCYNVHTGTETMDQGDAKSACDDVNAGVYTPVSAHIEQFLSASGIFDGVSFDNYWMYLKNNKWVDKVPANYTNYYSDGSEDAAVVTISQSHRWLDTDDHSLAAVICQEMVSCPNPVYVDSLGVKYCWFLPWDENEAQWDKSEGSCERYSPNAYMIELDTQEKMTFLRDESGILDTVSSTRYWLGLKMDSGDWRYSGQSLDDTWSNWDTANGQPGNEHGVYADVITHLWSTVSHNDETETALVICEVQGLEYNGYTTPRLQTTVPDTTASTTDQTTVQTTLQDTTVQDTTAVHTSLRDTTSVMRTSALESTSAIQTTTEYEPTSTQGPTSTTTQPTTSTTTEPSSIEGRRPLSEDFVLAETVVENLASISEETKSAMGYNSYEFILECQFEGWICDLSMFYQLYDPLFGNCYMFNSGWNRSVPIETAHRTGRRYGLSLVLNIGEDEYLSNIGGASGARIIVHNNRKMPHPDEDGYLAKPGELTSIGVQKVVISRKGHPFGNCTNEKKAPKIDLYSEIYKHVHYSRQNCFRTCYQRKVIKRCGCGDSYYPMSGKAVGGRRAHPCDTTNREEDDCRYRTNEDYAEGRLGCSDECPDACQDEYFVTSTSTALWPSTRHADTVLAKFADKIPDIAYSNDTEKYKRNLLAVEVFYDDFNYEHIEEVETYKTGQFASDVGGILGLWVGCSVISVFEFFELGIDLLVLGCLNALRRCRSPKLQRFSGGTKTGWAKSRGKNRDTTPTGMSAPATKWHIEDQNYNPEQASPRSSHGSDSSGFHDDDIDIPGTPTSATGGVRRDGLRPKILTRGRRKVGSAESSKNSAEKQSVKTPRGVNVEFFPDDVDDFAYIDMERPPDWWYEKKGGARPLSNAPPPDYSSVINNRRGRRH